MGTLTVTVNSIGVPGFERFVKGYFAAPAAVSYPLGGWSLAAADVGLAALDFIIVEPYKGYCFTYNYASAQLQMFVPGTQGASLNPAFGGLPWNEAATILYASITGARFLAFGT